MVKVNSQAPQGFQGSFGIPEELQQMVEEKKRLKEKKPEGKEEGTSEQKGDIPEYTGTDIEEEAKKEEKDEATLVLEALGITLTDDDITMFLLGEPIEKEVEIIKGRLRATFKPLIVNDTQEIEELVGEDIRVINMTKEGADNRRAILNIAYGVTQLQGKNLVTKRTNESGTPLSGKDMAIIRRGHFLKMPAQIFNLIFQKWTSFQYALNLVANTSDTYIKKS
jgi:hypothetical protein